MRSQSAGLAESWIRARAHRTVAPPLRPPKRPHFQKSCSIKPSSSYGKTKTTSLPFHAEPCQCWVLYTLMLPLGREAGKGTDVKKSQSSRPPAWTLDSARDPCGKYTTIELKNRSCLRAESSGYIRRTVWYRSRVTAVGNR